MMQVYNALDSRVKYNIQMSMGIVVINDITLPAKKIHVSGLADRAMYERLVEQGILEYTDIKAPTFLEPTYEFQKAYDGPEEIHISYVKMPNATPKLYSNGKPFNPRAWHNLYMKSHPKQRKKITWADIVNVCKLPEDWKIIRFS